MTQCSGWSVPCVSIQLTLFQHSIVSSVSQFCRKPLFDFVFQTRGLQGRILSFVVGLPWELDGRMKSAIIKVFHSNVGGFVLRCSVPAHTRKMGCANSKAGDRFDEAAFDAAAVDGRVPSAVLMEISSWLQALRDGATELDLSGPTLLGGRVGVGPGSHANVEPC